MSSSHLGETYEEVVRLDGLVSAQWKPLSAVEVSALDIVLVPHCDGIDTTCHCNGFDILAVLSGCLKQTNITLHAGLLEVFDEIALASVYDWRCDMDDVVDLGILLEDGVEGTRCDEIGNLDEGDVRLIPLRVN